MFNKYEWLLLDLDNTLLDFSNTSKQAFVHAIKPLAPVNTINLYDSYRQVNHHYWKAFEKGKITADDVQIGRWTTFLEEEKLMANPTDIAQAYMDGLILYSEWVNGAKQFLQTQFGKNKLAVITNGLSFPQRGRLEKHNMNAFFEHVFISQEMGISKPNFGYFEQVYKQIGQPDKSKVLVIGDNLKSDIRGGREFGFDTCWFNYNNYPNKDYGATYKIETWP